jgi:hypothetical protein
MPRTDIQPDDNAQTKTTLAHWQRERVTAIPAGRCRAVREIVGSGSEMIWVSGSRVAELPDTSDKPGDGAFDHGPVLPADCLELVRRGLRFGRRRRSWRGCRWMIRPWVAVVQRSRSSQPVQKASSVYSPRSPRASSAGRGFGTTTVLARRLPVQPTVPQAPLPADIRMIASASHPAARAAGDHGSFVSGTSVADRRPAASKAANGS